MAMKKTPWTILLPLEHLKCVHLLATFESVGIERNNTVDLLQELVGGLGGHGACACAGVGVEVVGGGSLEELVVVPCGKDRGSGQDGRRCLALGADDDVRGGARSWWEVVRGRR